LRVQWSLAGEREYTRGSRRFVRTPGATRGVESNSTAVQANPRMSARGSGWTPAETAGDVAQAEGDLVGRCKPITPTPRSGRWQFLFRRNDLDNFWRWRGSTEHWRRDGARSRTDLRLCWKLSGIRDGVDRAIPDVGAVQSRYLAFLVRENLAHVAEPVAQRVVALGGSAIWTRSWTIVYRLIVAVMRACIRAWNALCWRTLHSYRPLAPLTSPGLTNGDFASAPSARV